ncbi:hypothetical protein [sulfur-oxidizing endosymbiont of Gigantopelta aegis]|uniref:hypothetical protein n=1 Tax=sulfur-oxidizing endosymbiont of Gigantopelta aegis TaxID=2794934 RepID=UPI0018DC435F|nr:hypothetical protein [sulfur-oxidizing endosymbiont of Gigantopelta aegis]
MNIKLSTGICLFILLILGKLITLAKDIVLSSFYGVSWQADAYFIANGVPLLVFSAFYSTIPLVFLPAYNKI